MRIPIHDTPFRAFRTSSIGLPHLVGDTGKADGGAVLRTARHEHPARGGLRVARLQPGYQADPLERLFQMPPALVPLCAVGWWC